MSDSLEIPRNYVNASGELPTSQEYARMLHNQYNASLTNYWCQTFRNMTTADYELLVGAGTSYTNSESLKDCNFQRLQALKQLYLTFADRFGADSNGPTETEE